MCGFMLLRCLDTASRMELGDENNKNGINREVHSTVLFRLMLVERPCLSSMEALLFPTYLLTYQVNELNHLFHFLN